jgi:hypothetical protein
MYRVREGSLRGVGTEATRRRATVASPDVPQKGQQDDGNIVPVPEGKPKNDVLANLR